MAKRKGKKGKFGNCYEAALHFAAIDVPFEERDRYTVVHGYPTGQGPIEGVVHGHAWVERTEEVPEDLPEQFRTPGTIESLFITVIDKSNGKDMEVPRALYYAYGRIDPAECVRYTVAEAVEEALSAGHYGPWHDESDSPESAESRAETWVG